MILVTGFEPFQGEKINPTEKLIEELVSLKRSSKEFFEFETMILPVSFSEAPQALKNRIEQLQPKKVLMLGQAGGSEKIRLERVALNWQESQFADENGLKPQTGKINDKGNDAYFSSLDLPQLKMKLEAVHAPVEISFSAGSFVCNRIYYEFFRCTDKKLPGLFVHWPFLAEQVESKPRLPFLSWEMQRRSFIEILNFFKE